MKTSTLLLVLSLALPAAALAREWRDMKGRSFSGVLVHVQGSEVTFEKYGHGTFAVPLSTSSAEDREYIQRWKAARAQAVVLSVEVFQALKAGALVKGVELRHESSLQDVPKWYSKLDGRTITERKLVAGWKEYPLASEHAYVEGLDDVLDNMQISSLVVWPAGFHDYTTASGAARRVVKYTLTPPPMPAVKNTRR